MKPIRMTIMRNLRLKLKSGFMKEEPEEFAIMKRYPPLMRRTEEPYHEPKPHYIPYVHLYKKIVERNPIYIDEKVYDAYWMYEPEAVTFAKKQYELMQQGLEEEEAYQKAEAYIAELENEAYMEMKKVTDSIKKSGVESTFLSDPEVAKEVERWRARAKEVDLQYLDDHEWGELTLFIHDKVLKWNEVDRERRMKDVPFVNEFESIVNTLFGDRSDINNDKFFTRLKKDLTERLKFKNRIEKPFHVEDYIQHFTKVKNEPDIRKWSQEDRSIFSLWIVDVLTYRHLVSPEDVLDMEKYLKTTRSLFFPMLAFPHRAKEFAVPTVEQVKRLLYENDIGYKRASNGNLYVRRFYRLPRLLFPEAVDEMEKLLADAEEVEQRNLKKKEEEKMKLAAEDDEFEFEDDDEEESAASRSNRLRRALDDDAEDEDEYGDDDDEEEDEEEGEDDVVRECNDSFDRPFKRIPEAPEVTASPAAEKAKSTSKLDELMRTALKSHDEDNQEQPESDYHLYQPKLKETTIAPIEDDEQWRKTFAKYYRYPTTELEKVRERYFRSMEAEAPETAQNEWEMSEFRDYRMTNVVMSRTRLAKQYNDREAARKVVEWKKRGVWLKDFKPKDVFTFDESL